MIKKLSLFVLIVALVIIGGVLTDIYIDRQHILIAEKMTPIYGDLSVSASQPVIIAMLGPGEQNKVLRIIYEKDFMKIKVRTPAGEEGWLWMDKDIKLTKK